MQVGTSACTCCSMTEVFLQVTDWQSVVHAADLFAILKTTEKLERAWTRDLISAKEYEPLCAKLIAQFKTLWSTLRSSVRHTPHH
jgi:VPS28 protein